MTPPRVPPTLLRQVYYSDKLHYSPQYGFEASAGPHCCTIA